MGIARGWEKRVIRTKKTYAKRTVSIFSVSPQSRSLFSASFQTFRLTARARILEYARIRTVLQTIFPDEVVLSVRDDFQQYDY